MMTLWQEAQVSDVLSSLEVGMGGLTAAEARRRLAEYGPNKLPEPPRTSAWRRFLAQFHNIVILALLLGLTLPITAVQILWVNMITAVTLGIALAFEPSEHDTMGRPPRPRGEPLLSADLVWYIVLASGLFLGVVFGVYRYAVEQGYSIGPARTIAMNTLVVMEILQLLFIRNMYSPTLTWRQLRGTRVLWLAIALVVAGQLAITYLPPLQGVFETESVPAWDAPDRPGRGGTVRDHRAGETPAPASGRGRPGCGPVRRRRRGTTTQLTGTTGRRDPRVWRYAAETPPRPSCRSPRRAPHAPGSSAPCPISPPIAAC